MVRFLVLYPEPDNPAAFDRHYFEVHLPLARQLPGLRAYRVSRSPSVVRGPGPYHLVAELEWDDMNALRADFASPLGKELSRDVDEMARLCPDLRSLVYELEDQ